MKRERGLISDCTYNSKERGRETRRREGGGSTHSTHRACSWRMRTMSLFSLNRIYKPNRHTPTPLTQTHTISFFSIVTPRLSLDASPAQTHSLCEDFISSKKVRVIGCDGEKSWVQADVVGEWMGALREHFVPPVRASTLILFPVRSGVIYDSRASASRRMGTGHGHCDILCTRFSQNIKSNMHETVTGGGGAVTSLLTLCFCTPFHSLGSGKKKST